MGREISTSIEINAEPAKVWAILLNFAAFHEWNPFLKSITGEPKVGEFVNVSFSNGFKISPKVVSCEPNSEFKWAGKLACGGLFDGTHFFKLTPIDGGSKTRFDHGESFSGVLIPLLPGLLRETEANFIKMNEALKARAESS